MTSSRPRSRGRTVAASLRSGFAACQRGLGMQQIGLGRVSRETAPTGGGADSTLPAAPRVDLEVDSGVCSPGRATLAHRPGCVRVLQRMCPEGSETPRTPSSLPSNHHVNHGPPTQGVLQARTSMWPEGCTCCRRATGGRSRVAYGVREHCPAPSLQEVSRRTWLGGPLPLRLRCISGVQEQAARRPVSVCNVQ